MTDKFEVRSDTQTHVWKFGYPNWCSHQIKFLCDDRSEALLIFDFVAVHVNESVTIETCKVDMKSAISVLERYITTVSPRQAHTENPLDYETSTSYYVNEQDEARRTIGLWVGKQVMLSVNPLKQCKYAFRATDKEDTFIAIDFGVSGVEQVVKICAVASTPPNIQTLYGEHVYFSHAVVEIEKVRQIILQWFSTYDHKYNENSYRETIRRFTQDITFEMAVIKDMSPTRIGYLAVDWETHDLLTQEGLEGQLILNVEDMLNQYASLDTDDPQYVRKLWIRQVLAQAFKDKLGDVIVYID